MPPTRGITIGRIKIVENERGVSQFVQAERRYCQLARLKENIPVVFKTVRTLHDEQSKRLSDRLLNGFPVADLEPELD